MSLPQLLSARAQAGAVMSGICEEKAVGVSSSSPARTQLTAAGRERWEGRGCP